MILKGRRIVLDAGHGGKDPGATSGEFKEKDIALKYTLMLAEKLRNLGVIVFLVRSTDKFVDLNKRADIGKNNNADAFISIHTNAFNNEKAKGVETYHHRDDNGKSKQLAKRVHCSIVGSEAYTVDRGVKTAGFRVLRDSGQASILLELGFITNKDDLNIINNKQDEIINAIVEGLKEYFDVYGEQLEHHSLDLVIDGKDKEVDGFIQNGVSYVSIRDYGKKTGMNIGWNKEDRKILVDTKISDIDIEIEGERKKVRGINVKGENYVRFRDLAKVLDFNIDWDAIDRLVVIKRKVKGEG